MTTSSTSINTDHILRKAFTTFLNTFRLYTFLCGKLCHLTLQLCFKNFYCIYTPYPVILTCNDLIMALALV